MCHLLAPLFPGNLRQWEERETAAVGLRSPRAAQPCPPPGQEAQPKAPAGRGRGRVIFTSFQAAWATGSEHAARQMWGARQLGAATAGLAAGRRRGEAGCAEGGSRPRAPSLFPAAPAYPPWFPSTSPPAHLSVPSCALVPSVVTGLSGSERKGGPCPSPWEPGPGSQWSEGGRGRLPLAAPPATAIVYPSAAS